MSSSAPRRPLPKEPPPGQGVSANNNTSAVSSSVANSSTDGRSSAGTRQSAGAVDKSNTSDAGSVNLNDRSSVVSGAGASNPGPSDNAGTGSRQGSAHGQGEQSSSSRHAAELSLAQQSLDAYAVPDYTGRYSIVKSIGKGAYGAVYIALETVMPENPDGSAAPQGSSPVTRKVALKHIVNGFVSATDARRIYREIKVMAHFCHPNIVPLLEVVKPRDPAAFKHIYLVSELMETDLHRVIHSRQDLTSDHIAYFMYQTLCALKHIHAAGVLHRDLKPSNLLVNADCTLKMCDFGLARESDSSLSQALTEYVVTRWYRAPEVLLSGGRYTSAIDVWSAGCVLAELLLRRPLFPGENYLHQLQLITQTIGSPTDEDLHFVKAAPARAFMLRLPHAEPVPWATLMPHVRGPVLDLLSQMLTFDPDKRITVEDALAHPFLARVRAARKHVNEDMQQPKPFKLRVPGGSAALKAMSVEAIKARFFAELCGMPLTPSPTASPLGPNSGAFGLFGPMPVLASGAPAAAAAAAAAAANHPGIAVGHARPQGVPGQGAPFPGPQPPRGPPPRYGLPGGPQAPGQAQGQAPGAPLSALMPQPPPGMPPPGAAAMAGPGGPGPRPYTVGGPVYAGITAPGPGAGVVAGAAQGQPGRPAMEGQAGGRDHIISSPSRQANTSASRAVRTVNSSFVSQASDGEGDGQDDDMGNAYGQASGYANSGHADEYMDDGSGALGRSPAAGRPHHRVGSNGPGAGQASRGAGSLAGKRRAMNTDGTLGDLSDSDYASDTVGRPYGAGHDDDGMDAGDTPAAVYSSIPAAYTGLAAGSHARPGPGRSAAAVHMEGLANEDEDDDLSDFEDADDEGDDDAEGSPELAGAALLNSSGVSASEAARRTEAGPGAYGGAGHPAMSRPGASAVPGSVSSTAGGAGRSHLTGVPSPVAYLARGPAQFQQAQAAIAAAVHGGLAAVGVSSSGGYGGSGAGSVTGSSVHGSDDDMDGGGHGQHGGGYLSYNNVGGPDGLSKTMGGRPSVGAAAGAGAAVAGQGFSGMFRGGPTASPPLGATYPPGPGAHGTPGRSTGSGVPGSAEKVPARTKAAEFLAQYSGSPDRTDTQARGSASAATAASMLGARPGPGPTPGPGPAMVGPHGLPIPAGSAAAAAYAQMQRAGGPVAGGPVKAGRTGPLASPSSARAAGAGGRLGGPGAGPLASPTGSGPSAAGMAMAGASPDPAYVSASTYMATKGPSATPSAAAAATAAGSGPGSAGSGGGSGFYTSPPQHRSTMAAAGAAAVGLRTPR